jgi:aminopeptidase N
VYSPTFFDGSQSVYVIVHELAHQWFGDSVSVHRWSDIWLNEGFATAAEWLYREHVGQATTQESLVAAYRQYPADDPLWRVTIGDPGPTALFHTAVYDRGAMTLLALRNRVGDTAFRQLLREWAARHRYGNATVEGFVALAEQICGEDLHRFFHTWLYTPSKPAATAANGLPSNAAEKASAGPSSVVGSTPLHPVHRGQSHHR